MATLKLTDVGKTYGGTIEVLRHINLDIKAGELIVFVGPSGCGKSTLLRMIAGLERITAGTLEIGGQVVNDGIRLDCGGDAPVCLTADMVLNSAGLHC